MRIRKPPMTRDRSGILIKKKWWRQPRLRRAAGLAFALVRFSRTHLVTNIALRARSS
ncbi:unnamed protein product, partial [Amoebophrya sp. A120]|eukprot:GSA120T00000621001.1